MFNFTYPQVSNIEVVSTQPKPADLRSIEYIRATENTTLDNVTYVVKINLMSKLPATSFGVQLYLDNYYVREYSGFKNGIYLKINNPHFFSEHAGKEIRFSLDGGETFHNTGIRLPNLTDSEGRSLTPADLRSLPTQEEVLK
jgi:hypothetical protein